MADKVNFNNLDVLSEHYKKQFNPKDYVSQYYKECDMEWRFSMTNYYRFFFNASESAAPKNSYRLLDFGCGPTPIYTAAAAAASLPVSITYSDINEDNRNAITKTIKYDAGKESAWKDYFAYLEKISGRRSSDIRSDLKSSFNEAVFGDAHSKMPIPGKENYFDAIITNMCLEYACADHKTWKQSVQNLCNMIRPGRYLVMGGDLDTYEYEVRGDLFPAAGLTLENIKNVFNDQDTGMQLLRITTCTTPPKTLVKKTGPEAMKNFFLVAQKMGKNVQKMELIEEKWDDEPKEPEYVVCGDI